MCFKLAAARLCPITAIFPRELQGFVGLSNRFGTVGSCRELELRFADVCRCTIGCISRSFRGRSSGFIFNLNQSSSAITQMASLNKHSSVVAPLPPDDEVLIKDGTNEATVSGPFQQESKLLEADEDKYDGVIVDPNRLPCDVAGFVSSLKASLAEWRQQGKKGVWLKVPITHANLVPAAIEEGFWYHHAEPTYVMLAHWIPQSPCTLPANASHQVGVGGFVVNDKREVLAVQEKNGPFRGSGVWKMPTGLLLEGEDLFTGIMREVKEETGIDTEFLELVGFRHSHHAAFEKSDLFFICMLRPLSSNIIIQELEIDKAQWMPAEEFVAQPFYQQHGYLKKMFDVCIASYEKRYKGFSAVQTVPMPAKQHSFFYYNVLDMN
eukprot:Gb_28827 [translate_table: standard]